MQFAGPPKGQMPPSVMDAHAIWPRETLGWLCSPLEHESFSAHCRTWGVGGVSSCTACTAAKDSYQDSYDSYPGSYLDKTLEFAAILGYPDSYPIST